MRNDSRIAAETRRKVAQIANLLGYQPDVAAQRLVSRYHGIPILFKMIGLVWNANLGALPQYSFYQVLLNGIMSACWEKDHALMLMNIKRGHAQNMLFASQVDGLILLPADHNEYVEAALCLGKPLVAIFGKNSSIASVDVDDAEAVRIAFEHLYKLDHRRIGFIGRNMSDSSSAPRWTAYCNCLKTAGLAYDDSFVYTDSTADFEPEGAKALHQIWSRGQHPSALVVYNDKMALGVLRAAAELGLHVPNDLAIVSIDDIPEASTSRPPLSTVAIDIEGMGHKAVSMIEEFARSQTYAPDQITMKLELKKRGSS